MLIKFFITLLLVGGLLVWLRWRKRSLDNELSMPASKPNPDIEYGLKRWWPGLAIVALLSVILWFVQGYRQGEQVLQVTVTGTDGHVSTYLVKRKDFNGRRLVTVDGLQVQLSQLDRVETALK